ncbi:MAG: AsmA-like C-terminal domain-containing protein [Rhodospirillales bacterium]
MIGRTVRVGAYLLGGLVLVLTVVAGGVAWRLSQGPVSLAFLTPTIEALFDAEEHPFRLRLGDTILLWDRRERALDVRFSDVRAVGASGEVIARLPEMAVRLDHGALLRGVVAAVDIELFGPSLTLRRRTDGALDVQVADQGPESGAFVGRLLADLLAAPDPRRPMSYLERVRIVDAKLSLADERLGLVSTGRVREARLWHDGTSIRTEAFLTATLNGEQAQLAMIGAYEAPTDQLNLAISFDDLRPAAFAPLAPALRELADFDLPLRGTVRLAMDGIGTVVEIGVDVIGGGGTLALPASVAGDIGLPASPLRLSVRDSELRGRYRRDGTTIEIDDVEITFAEGETLAVPAPVEHVFPIASVTGKGRYLGDDGRLEVDTLAIDLAGPKLTVSGVVDGIGEAVAGAVSITVNDLAADDLARYWPSSLAHDARAWTVAALSEGVFPEARFDLTLATGAGGVDVSGLAGTIAAAGLAIDYLPPMPKVRGASGRATLDLERLAVTIAGGEAVGVVVREGTVVLSDLGRPVPRADIDLNVAGPVRDVLALLDHPPLGYPGAMGIDPAKTGGTAEGRVRFGIPLLKTLTLDALAIAVDARVADLAIADAVLGKDISGGTLALKLDARGLDAEGRIALGAIDTDVVWRENFTDDAPFASRFDLAIADADAAAIADLGLTLPPVLVADLHGRLAADVRLTRGPGAVGRLEVRLDATNAGVTLPLLGLTKGIGEPAAGELSASLDGDRLSEIPRFALSAADLDIAGSARFGVAAEGADIELQRIAHGRTDLSGRVDLHADGNWDLSVAGASVDLEPVWAVARRDDEPATAPADEPRFTLTADIGTAWLGEDRRVDRPSVTVASERGILTDVRASGLIDGRNRLDASISPATATTRSLAIEGEDAGATLRTLGLFDDLVGGVLRVEGVFDDDAQDRSLKGRLRVRDYRLINAPGLARVLSIMALTGIRDALRGQGIAFSKLDVPFKWRGDTLEIDNAQASGPSIGVTASGTVDLAAQTFDLRGTVVPFYTVNAVLGRIPILGDLLTGGERGGGIFAALYTMRGPLHDPDVSVNPVSVLAPGFLRNLFSIFDNGGSDSPRDSSQHGGDWQAEPQTGSAHP